MVYLDIAFSTAKFLWQFSIFFELEVFWAVAVELDDNIMIEIFSVKFWALTTYDGQFYLTQGK